MIAPETQRKIWLGGLITVVILGIFFLIWAVFLNRSAIIINSKAPFALQIEGLRTESCTGDNCSTAVAPGKYTITLQKAGYKSVSEYITVPFGHPYEETIDLQYIPVITESTAPAAEIFPPAFTLTKAQRDHLGIETTTQISYNTPAGTQPKFLTYMARNPENNRQTLYIATIGGAGEISEPQVVTSFIRDLQNAIISPNTTGDKVAAIDQGEAPSQATLYMIDLIAKNRASIVTYPAIRDMRWIQDSNDFLFQAREKSDAPEAIYWYRWDDGKIYKLDLNTSLDDIAIVNKSRILAATSQKTAGKPVEGQLVSLAPTLSTSTATTTSAIVDYSLIANEARLITTLSDGTLPTRVRASADQKTLYYEQDGKIFELRFEE